MTLGRFMLIVAVIGCVAGGCEYRHGTYTERYDNGHVWRVDHYKFGQRDGESTEWYSDGTMARQGSWANGDETGLWRVWQPNGEKDWEATYENGKIVGDRTFWQYDFNTRQLSVSRVDSFGDDGVIDKIVTWYPDGTKAVEGHINGTIVDKWRKHGSWTYWNPDGSVQAEGVWKDGKPWSGVCVIRAVGDAGSTGGIEYYRVFDCGVDVGPASRPSGERDIGGTISVFPRN